MIRSALIALGLSAGALSALFSGASGATAARAQGMVRAAPIVEVCGGTPVEQTEACINAVGDAPRGTARDGQTTTQVSEGDVFVATGPVRTVMTVVADADRLDHPVIEMRLSVRCGAVPFHRNAVFQDTMDGSNPSADFCP